jgi:DNA-binding transcriptional MerR regulator
MNIRETYVRVQEAAKILGVAPNTIRAWGAAGKIQEFRHPINGHRLYRREDLVTIFRKIEQTPTPAPRRKR